MNQIVISIYIIFTLSLNKKNDLKSSYVGWAKEHSDVPTSWRDDLQDIEFCRKVNALTERYLFF